MIPAVTSAKWSDDPALQDVTSLFDDGKIAGFIDHQVPAGIPLDSIVTRGLMDNNPMSALATLDNEWAKVVLPGTID